MFRKRARRLHVDLSTTSEKCLLFFSCGLLFLCFTWDCFSGCFFKADGKIKGKRNSSFYLMLLLSQFSFFDKRNSWTKKSFVIHLRIISKTTFFLYIIKGVPFVFSSYWHFSLILFGFNIFFNHHFYFIRVSMVGERCWFEIIHSIESDISLPLSFLSNYFLFVLIFLYLNAVSVLSRSICNNSIFV